MASGIPHVVRLADPPNLGAGRAPTPVFESSWEQKLCGALEGRGLTPIPQYELVGRRLDLALVGDGKVPIDIEVDGARFHREPDGSRRRDDIWRDIQVQGAGWRVLRFWVHELRDDMERCVRVIERTWEQGS